MKTVALPLGDSVPALGMGTWYVGDDPAKRSEEIVVLRDGVECGLRVIDTAEMYGDGRSEELVGEAIAPIRDEVFVVSKVYPFNAGRQKAIQACERSLKRLGTDRIDLYLLHWRGSVPFAETIETFELLKEQGKIGSWGVSNLDIFDMRELTACSGGNHVAVNQILYNLTRRGPEFDLLPWMEKRGIAAMAYSPIEQARLLNDRSFVLLAKQYGYTPAQLALAFVLDRDQTLAIPKTSSLEHLRENIKAAEIKLEGELKAKLEALFPAPTYAEPLEML
ncbi:aldo/keto reductase [Rhodobacteraceae bacterium RKSG542]|uniref:aldo/keto reductase n=1 Tax=Pseudovibrio flavus TaxID=2529854 RepID=UPI0012BD4791|nr:aldo/keto reductase [Pseudovibrio flavus]MTI16019.1 aldo/keto reductase [Pseudovibrio flavus]